MWRVVCNHERRSVHGPDLNAMHLLIIITPQQIPRRKPTARDSRFRCDHFGSFQCQPRAPFRSSQSSPQATF